MFAGELHHFRPPRRLRVHFKMYAVPFILHIPGQADFREIKRGIEEEEVDRNKASKLISNISMRSRWLHSATLLVPQPKYVSPLRLIHR